MKIENTKLICDVCLHVFNEGELVEVHSSEYLGAKSWGYYVSPCCHSMDYTELDGRI